MCSLKRHPVVSTRPYYHRQPPPIRMEEPTGSGAHIGAAVHSDCPTNISPQAHPIKHSDQGIKCTLEPARFQQCNHAIVRIEEGSLVPSLLSTITPLLLSLYHNHQPVLYHLIHHHIEYGGGERISLCYSTLSPKLLPVVSARHCYHRQPPLICLE